MSPLLFLLTASPRSNPLVWAPQPKEGPLGRSSPGPCFMPHLFSGHTAHWSAHLISDLLIDPHTLGSSCSLVLPKSQIPLRLPPAHVSMVIVTGGKLAQRKVFHHLECLAQARPRTFLSLGHQRISCSYLRDLPLGEEAFFLGNCPLLTDLVVKCSSFLHSLH